ncbi:hypothetical protein SDC9_206159 [bioreactor metagenome]|uniref:Uncharacterized protein n=1 Tax=bioreactor metagenome TaxID=1076179 RepID=A0A645JDH3_9ZZZZ|nr:hypothetical protein [Candidatus Metalachnospira sp.]
MPKAVNKKTDSTVGSFTKAQLMASKKYKDYRDVLAAILSDNYLYSRDEVDTMIHDFMNKEV